jgi:hypothetical protein
MGTSSKKDKKNYGLFLLDILRQENPRQKLT